MHSCVPLACCRRRYARSVYLFVGVPLAHVLLLVAIVVCTQVSHSFVGIVDMLAVSVCLLVSHLHVFS